jgi:hypothetical protein
MRPMTVTREQGLKFWPNLSKFTEIQWIRWWPIFQKSALVTQIWYCTSEIQ